MSAASHSPLCSQPHSHEHGAADEEEEVKAVVISEEGVPDPDDVRQQELLGQQQRQPAEGKELRLDVLLLLGRQRHGEGARIRVGWLPRDIIQPSDVNSEKQQARYERQAHEAGGTGPPTEPRSVQGAAAACCQPMWSDLLIFLKRRH